MESDFNQRIVELLDTIRKKRCLKFEEFVIIGLKNGRIQVNGYLFYKNLNEIPKASIKIELEKIKYSFLKLMNRSQILKEHALKVGIDYHLVLDIGGAGINICAEIEGEYKEFI